MNISFFGKRPARLRKSGRLQRGSSEIRAIQMAKYFGVKYNPTEGYENDVCIYVKPEWGTVFAKKAYIDILDGVGLIPIIIKERPDIPIIVAAQENLEFLQERFNIPNKLILIPQHHCNFDRKKRERIEIKNIGEIKTRFPVSYSLEEITKKMNNADFDFKQNIIFRNRQDVVNFYKQIDIQIIWRPKRQHLKNPLKIINAASFGIPTIAYPEKGFKEVEGYYIRVKTFDELIEKAKELRNDPALYSYYSKKGIELAEKYHIDNIAKLYKQLT